MESITVIQNDFLTVKISNVGAELKSIKDSDNTERLWQGDERYWRGQSPLLFPICGCLTESRYLLNGKSYTIPSHGFARKEKFSLECLDKDKAVFLLKSNEETLKMYPFMFELRVTYTLIENKLSVTYTVNNKSDSEMYFSIGSHEGFMCKGDITDYNLYFEKKDNPKNFLLNGAFLNDESEPAPVFEGVMEFDDAEFKRLDTYIFKNPDSKCVTLKKKGETRFISVEFPQTPNLLIWKEPGGEFLCIEPWCGLPDHYDEVRELSDKDGIVTLEKNGIFSNTHTIIIG